MAATAEQQVENPVTESRAKKLTRKNKKQRTTKKKIRIRALVPGISCFKKPNLEIENDDGNREGDEELRSTPSHLIVTVNGIVGSADDWKYAVEQFLKQYPKDALVHRSKRNSATLTFDGVDVMGERLADEVLGVIKRYPDLRKISFLGHSLGGLISRYAIARLYQRNYLIRHPSNDGEDGKHQSSKEAPEENSKKEVAALEPINFITFATPHLGSRGSKQVPLFGGIHALEKIARQTSGLLGRTGKHLFLTDNDDGKPPLLLRMTNDYEDLPFISALKSFRHRVLYANVRYDHIVGWSTSSLRHQKELPQRQSFPRNDRYRHIVNVETPKPRSSEAVYPLDSAFDGWKRFDTNAMMEAMLSRLTKLEWERVDVEFSGTKQRFLAHNTIQVTSYRLHSQGADVIQHMIDNFLL
ncbi:putative lipase ROG1 [Drosera capensis]